MHARSTIREVAEADLAASWRACEEAGIGGASVRRRKRASSSPGCASIPSTAFFVAATDGTIAGTYFLVILDKLVKRGARAGVLDEVAVLTAFEGRGIGRGMMEHAREGAHRF